MRRRQFLWIHPRGADCYYLAPGNVALNAGAKGTLLIWQWPFWFHDEQDSYWRISIDANNYIRNVFGRGIHVRSGGVDYRTWHTRSTASYVWELCVYTWDFTTPGAGVVRTYWQGSEAGTAITNANAPVGTPSKIYLGPVQEQEMKGPYMIAELAIWDGVMTAAQVAALWQEGPRHVARSNDGTGNLLLLCSFNQRYDADVAMGSGRFGAEGPADHYCLVNDGATQWRRRSFLIGMPRHDLSEDDRVPICVPCPTVISGGALSKVSDTNYPTYGEIAGTTGLGTNVALGAPPAGPPVFDANFLAPGSTYRQRIHIPGAEVPAGSYVRIGPVDYLHYPCAGTGVYDGYGSGRRFSVVSDAGNTASQFKTDLGSYPTGYWVGAYVVFVTGNCQGRRLRVTGWDSASKVLTLESPLPATPAAGSVGIVDHRARLIGVLSKNDATMGTRIPEMNMDAWLWEFHGGYVYFTELEYQFSTWTWDANRLAPNTLRYDRGRTAYLDGAPAPHGERGAWYGHKKGDPEFNFKILLERVEIDGPGTYQVLRRDAQGVGPDYADNFMVRASNGHSTKVWRTRNVEWVKTKPTKITTPEEVKADLQSPGTWRHSVGTCPVPISYDESSQTVTAAVIGTDASGVSRVGYIKGRWDDSTGRIRWTDEPAPPERTNPFIRVSELRPLRCSDVSGVYVALINILQAEDGSWALIYGSKTSEPDHSATYLWYGAEDRWSFERSRHWWDGNPVVSFHGGPDMVNPDGDGFGIWANRDAQWNIVKNEYTGDNSRRYIGLGRGKTILHRDTGYSWDTRPTCGIRGSDLRAMVPLPHGNVLSPLPGPLVHSAENAVLDQGDCIGLYTDTAIGFTSGVYCHVSEDGVHFQEFAKDTEWIWRGELPGEPTRLSPGRPFRLGDKRIYYYGAGGWLNFAWIRWNGECWYQLQSSQSEGYFETAAMERPAGGWGDLLLNASPADGTVAVELLDGDTDEVLPGFSRGDCDGCSDSVEHKVTWRGVGLAGLSTEVLRLRFWLQRGSGSSPRVYSWRILDASQLPPVVVDHSPTGTGVPEASKITVRFSQRMDRASTEGAFTLVPETPGGFLWSEGERVLTFVPDGELAEDREYTVIVGMQARAASGKQLGATHEWSFTTVRRPSATRLQLNGRSNPSNVVDPQPELSWEYSDPGGLPQSAYHLIVATSREALEEHTGDMWDTGVVESGLTRVRYQGAELASDTVYYWAVRVRNSEGVWSEEW